MSFNMDDYVDVATRIAMAKEKYPEMSLQPANILEPFKIVEIGQLSFVVYTAALYRDPMDPTPAIGIAWEQVPGTTPYTRGSELMNAETSAWGRACIAAGLPSKKIASADEMASKVSPTPILRLDAKQAKAAGMTAWDIGQAAANTDSVVWDNTAPTSPTVPTCIHGDRKVLQGTSSKTGKDYYGYGCTADRDEQCEPIWYVLHSNGEWGPKS